MKFNLHIMLNNIHIVNIICVFHPLQNNKFEKFDSSKFSVYDHGPCFTFITNKKGKQICTLYNLGHTIFITEICFGSMKVDL